MSEEIDYAARVQRGAALLDEKWPTWAQDIDLEKLDIQSGRNCVTAQFAQRELGGTYWFDALDHLGLTEGDDGSYISHGFNAESYREERPYDQDEAYTELNTLWRDLIQERRAQAQPEASER